jgi:serine/threonine-protein kinase
MVAQRWLLQGPKDYLLGAQLGGKYRLLHPLGQGQFGRVYHAQQEGAGGVLRSVAVKVLREDRAEMHALFLDEVKVISQLKSAHITQYLDSGFDTQEGLIYLVMEMIEGETLSQTLDREERLSPERALELTAQLLIALEEAHAERVVHRDLKPANMMITLQGGEEVLKVLDFGVSRPNADQPREQTQGLLPGTPAYMAPELFQGYTGEVTPQMDLFAVGVVCFQLITGELPFVVEGDAENLIGYYKLYSQRPKPPRLPQLDRRLELILQRALSLDPKRRFQSARELLIALAPWSVTASRHVGELRPEGEDSAPRPKRFMWLAAAALIGGLIGLAAHSSRVMSAEESAAQPSSPSTSGVSTQQP